VEALVRFKFQQRSIRVLVWIGSRVPPGIQGRFDGCMPQAGLAAYKFGGLVTTAASESCGRLDDWIVTGDVPVVGRSALEIPCGKCGVLLGEEDEGTLCAAPDCHWGVCDECLDVHADALLCPDHLPAQQ
jgi:hypothetical protein